MAGLDFKAPEEKEQECAMAVAYNRRLGVLMFAAYFALYGGFMALSAFWPEVMARPVLAGVNLAVVYGLILIVAAIVFALVYLKLCRKAN